MKKDNSVVILRPLTSGVCALAMAAAVCTGASAAGFDEALVNGKVAVDLRYRYEFVDQQNKTKSAQAMPMRLRLGYGTSYANVAAYFEFEHISAIGEQRYNSTTNNKVDYPVVADPAITELNQGFVTVSAIPNTDIKLGRQRLILDNARFVGNVGWRQNEQTFDAATLINQSVPNLRLFYALLRNANTITGGDDEMTTHLLNAGYQFKGFGTLSGYGYFLDYDAKADTQTMGLRFTGQRDVLANVAALYTLEYARQRDYADNAADFDVGYGHAEAGVAVKGVTARLGYEVLGGSGVTAFQTPLATKHAFNGWDDQFLTTPANGLADLYLSLNTTLLNTKLAVVVHDFKAEEGGAHYGREWGLAAVKPFAKMYSVGLKYASYMADTHAADTNKLWLTAQFTF